MQILFCGRTILSFFFFLFFFEGEFSKFRRKKIVQEILKTGCGLIRISKKKTNIFLEDFLRFEGARNSRNSDFEKSWGFCFLFLGQNNPCLKFEVQSFFSISEEGSKEARKSSITRVCFCGYGI
jgi:hypothetical protein